ncbi:uncharacterized protein EV422DRAFT_385308 [Fimicolochytrium jonesii]|uniref:uncharacterized protein n=1 Tax=Fimicolochytrium jonesii TaxID=1396493 RepID=UPI0022FDE468|nr:uncharacterized protein EV422DRAFT_385308 [Fimicolochytrium jonesii]KAI8822943.1 hypothetical protein EV422DRAFT_385308 [Fimicolochytrium jonesii]
MGFPFEHFYKNEIIRHRLSVAASQASIPPTTRQSEPLTVGHLETLALALDIHNNHNHAVHWTMSLTGFWGLARRRELVTDGTAQTIPDIISLSDVSAVPTRSGESTGYAIRIRRPKVRTAHMQHLVFYPRSDPLCPAAAMSRLLAWHAAHHHPANQPLWTLSDGSYATSVWFIGIWVTAAAVQIGTSLLRSGGATEYAFEGYPFQVIQRFGRWSSDAFEQYIRSHPAFLVEIMLRYRPT